jgi:ketosteroid isomerase-like protein
MADEAATPDLVELTRRVFEAADRRDFDAVLASFAPDAVWDSQVLETSFAGVAAIRGFLERWSAAYDRFEVRAEDIVDFGHGVVLCVFMNKTPAAGGEGEPSLRFALVIVWADGVVMRVIGSEHLDEARAAAERLAQERADG